MKQLIASVAALGIIASPAVAASTTKTTTKTMTTKTAGAKATTTVTTKVTPTAAKGKSHAMAKHHSTHSKAAMAQAAHKPAPKAKTTKTS